MPEPADNAAVRAEVRAWLEGNWDPELSLLEWRRRLATSGWGCPAWPREWCGRSLPGAAAEIVAAEFARAGAVGPAVGVGMQLAAPTILQHGSDELKRRFIRPTVTGEIVWCQLFSEPGAGSDLAGLTTRAEPDGSEWAARGQKVWTTGAAHAGFGLLLARTDWDVPKHKGITYFVIPMKQPGVDVRPLRQMNGHATFNEVFLDGARIPAGNVIGGVGNGWAVALTTLAHERRLAPIFPAAAPRPRPPLPQASPGLAGTAPGASSEAAPHGRALREAAAERLAASEPHKWYPQRAGRVDLVIERAAAAGKSGDPVVRQEIARLITLAWSAEWASQRAAAARASGRPPGPEGSLGKLASSNIARAASRVHALIVGASGMLAGPGSPLEGTIAEIFLSVPAISIAGGTDEIQRNIIGERILGLPKEPDLSRDRPFRQVRTNAPPEPSGGGQATEG